MTEEEKKQTQSVFGQTPLSGTQGTSSQSSTFSFGQSIFKTGEQKTQSQEPSQFQQNLFAQQPKQQTQNLSDSNLKSSLPFQAQPLSQPGLTFMQKPLEQTSQILPQQNVQQSAKDKPMFGIGMGTGMAIATGQTMDTGKGVSLGQFGQQQQQVTQQQQQVQSTSFSISTQAKPSFLGQQQQEQQQQQQSSNVFSNKISSAINQPIIGLSTTQNQQQMFSQSQKQQVSFNDQKEAPKQISLKDMKENQQKQQPFQQQPQIQQQSIEQQQFKINMPFRMEKILDVNYNINNQLNIAGIDQGKNCNSQQVNINQMLGYQIPDYQLKIIDQFGKIYKESNIDLDRIAHQAGDAKNNRHIYLNEIQRIGNKYLEFLYLCYRNAAILEEKNTLIGMIEVWNLFDSAYLSRNRPDSILKLFRLIRFLNNPDQLYREIERKLQHNETIIDQLIKLVALGDFPNVFQKIVTHPQYNEQDTQLREIADILHNLSRMFSQLEIGSDISMTHFNSLQQQRVSFCQEFINKIKQRDKYSFHHQLLPLVKLLAGDQEIINRFQDDYLKQSAMMLLFAHIPGDQEFNFSEVITIVYQQANVRKMDQFTQKVCEFTQYKPLLFLHYLDEILPPIISFHLSHLYQRYSLYPIPLSNKYIYQHMMNEQTHQYFEYLFSNSKVQLESFLPYVNGLAHESQKQELLNLLISKYVVLSSKEHYEKAINAIQNVLSGNFKQDMTYKVQESYAFWLLRTEQFQKAFDVILSNDRLDFVTTLSRNYVNGLLDDTRFDETIFKLQQIRNQINQYQRQSLCQRSNDFEFLLLFLELYHACYDKDNDLIEKCLQDFSVRMNIPIGYYKPIFRILYPSLIGKPKFIINPNLDNQLKFSYNTLIFLSEVLVYSDTVRVKSKEQKDISEVIGLRLVANFQ